MSACCTTPPRPAPPCPIPHPQAPAPPTTVPSPRRDPGAAPRPPTTAKTRTEPVLSHANDPPQPPHTRRPQSPHQLDPHPHAALGASPADTDSATALLEPAQLVHHAVHGDPAAWQEIMRRYSGLVTAKVRAFRLQDADALDAIQTTWLRLAENIHRIQHPERLGGWLATTAARECLRILHHAQRTPTVADAMIDALTDPSASPEQHIINAHTAQTLRTLIAELPPRRRRVLRALFTDHPPSYAQLSRSTGIRLGSIGPTRNRALRQLRQMLHDHELLPPTK
ncbi:MAG: sigma-70 family RNA polymerase sigma factor [Actinomycetota bacterium]|nr:sigma-70 family RNA polymerase sigma factor [Actinomycetota bacterium]